MANFHTNNLVVAADDDNMLAVLQTMAINLVSRSKETGYSDLLLDAPGPANAFSRMSGALSDWYYYALASAPIGSEQWKADHPDYQKREIEGNPACAGVVAAAESFADALLGARVSVRIEPSARPLSESAAVTMDRFGQTNVLRLSYSTANRSNFEDVERLFSMLPGGSYGLAFLDADEGDGYKEVAVFSGLSHGGLAGAEFECETMEVRRALDLYDQAKELVRNDLALSGDLVEVAASFAICNWSEFLWAKTNGMGSDEEGEALYDGIDIRRASSDHFSYLLEPSFDAYEAEDATIWSAHVIDYEQLSSGDIGMFERNVVPLLRRFPFECEVTGQAYEGRNANIEHLVPGAAVQLKSDWKNPYFKGAGIEVRDASGRRLANLGGYLNPSDLDRVTLACLLPHIKATAIDVSPLGATVDGRRKQGQFTLHLEIEPIDLSSALEEVRVLLSSKPDDRVRTSLMPE